MKRTIRKVKKPDNSSKLVCLSTTNSNGLASSVSSSRCAYVAGCVLVVYDVDYRHPLAPRGFSTNAETVELRRRLQRWAFHSSWRGRKSISSDKPFSGTQLAVLVWDVETLALVYELKGHLFGVGCIAFSPDGRHLVSVGGYIHLWEWRIGMLVTKLKASASCSAISSVSFSSDAKFVITAGKKHLMFWTVRSSPKTRLSKGNVSMTMHGKAVNLGLQKGRSFISVEANFPSMCFVPYTFWFVSKEVCGFKGSFYVPHMVLGGFQKIQLVFKETGIFLEACIAARTVDKGFAVSVSDKLIACACSSGIVRLFTIETLKYAGSLSYSKDKKGGGIGNNDIFCPNKDVETDFQLLPNLPDAVALVIYGDHSLYIWNIHDVNQATRCYVLLSHSACIWDVKNLCCDNLHDQSLACVARGCSGGVSFATCSTDGSIRLWDLSFQPNPSEDLADHHPLNTESMSTTRLVSTGTFERDAMELGFSAQGFRSMAVSPDGKYLAAGDSKGSLHIYDLHTFDYTCFQDAHDSEILSLSFSLSSKKHVDSKEVTTGHYFLASGGRDQLIHLYDVRRNFDLIESIDDHSAAVTSVKLACNGHKILSSAADRSLVFRDISVTDNGFQISHRLHQMASHGTVYDMVVDPKSEIAVTVGQDKKINTFDIASGRLIRSFKQNKYSGDPIKVTMDPSCSYLVCSDSNKSLYIYDFITGEMVTQVMGHGEVITGVIFLPDCKHIISIFRILTMVSEHLRSMEPFELREKLRAVLRANLKVSGGSMGGLRD
ncbi:mitogen-activated protein kinase-binding protein 1 [Morus notabilis]|uniref:mitogen-activated protein kinase-binding protein 1 n=1 Tax=Morus notabilis TaxID=981085 RepID=UPI000CECF6F9|nr:mitogen-activated protein kinase-binding protein 1 [Morus notabilis]